MSAARDGSIGWNEIEGDLAAALRELRDLRTQLAAQRANELQAELDLRNAAPDAASTLFLIVDAQAPDQPIVYVNRAHAALHGYGTPEEPIEDNGCGIAADNLDRIFDPFFTTKEVGRGTGQGFASARSIVIDKHGGEIHVRSEVARGTQFTLRLSVKRCRSAKAQP